MEKEVKEKALDDVKLIKEIIDKTSSSMLNFGSMFMKCGILFFCVAIIFIVGGRLPVPSLTYSQFPFEMPKIIFLQILSSIPLLAIIIVPIIIYKGLINNNQLKGVSKHIMIFWSFILSFILVSFIVSGFSDYLLNIYNPFHINIENNTFSYLLPLHLILFAFGLFFIYIFTNMRFPLILGSIYTFLSIFIMIIQPPWSIYNFLLIPVTFLVIGVYFKLYEIKVK